MPRPPRARKPTPQGAPARREDRPKFLPIHQDGEGDHPQGGGGVDAEDEAKRPQERGRPESARASTRHELARRVAVARTEGAAGGAQVSPAAPFLALHRRLLLPGGAIGRRGRRGSALSGMRAPAGCSAGCLVEGEGYSRPSVRCGRRAEGCRVGGSRDSCRGGAAGHPSTTLRVVPLPISRWGGTLAFPSPEIAAKALLEGEKRCSSRP